MKKRIKYYLLKFGGYKHARSLYNKAELYTLARRIDQFIQTGILPLPDRVIFEPTLRCNLKCKMCYQDRRSFANFRELTFTQITTFFDRTPYLKHVSLIGGEIFLRPDIMDMIHYLDGTKNIVISTNGTLLGEKEIAFLKQCRRIFTICVSLDGSMEIHDSIRCSAGSYRKAMKVIEELAPYLPLTVNCVIQSENLEILPAFINHCSEMGVKKIILELERIYSNKTIKEATAETILQIDEIPKESINRWREYSLESLINILQKCHNLSKQTGIYLTFDPFFLMEQTKACYHGNLRDTHHLFCKNFRTATIAPNGDLIHCRKIRKSIGNIFDAPLEDQWNSESARAFRQQLMTNNLNPICENCPSILPSRLI